MVVRPLSVRNLPSSAEVIPRQRDNTTYIHGNSSKSVKDNTEPKKVVAKKPPWNGFSRGSKLTSPDITHSIGIPLHYLNFFLRHIYLTVIFKYNVGDLDYEKGGLFVDGAIYDQLEAVIIGRGGQYGVWSKYEKIISSDTTKQMDSKEELSLTPLFIWREVGIVPDATDGKPSLDLVAVEDGCPVGYTFLQPIAPCVWQNSSLKCDFSTDRPLLGHPKTEQRKKMMCFPTAWPFVATEWQNRRRPAYWPDAGTVKQVVENGCYIIPKQPPATASDTMWKFSFVNAERLIALSAVTVYQRECFHWFLLIVRHCLKGSKIEYDHLKSVFFSACENLKDGLWKTQRTVCIFQMLRDLLMYFKRGFLPNYFIKAQNMIDHIQSHNLEWHVNKLNGLCQNFFLTVYFMLDEMDLIWYSLLPSVDLLVKDVSNFLLHQNISKSTEDSLLPFSIQCIKVQCLFDKGYDKALELATASSEELQQTTIHKANFAMEELLKTALASVSTNKKICFAFYADQTVGTNLLANICSGYDTVKLENVFGPDLLMSLRIKTMPIILKECLEYGQISAFALDFTDMLQNCLKVKLEVYSHALHYFLKSHAKSVLQFTSDLENSNISSEERSFVRNNLRILFTKLYICYLEIFDPYRFIDLVDLLEELLDQIGDPEGFQDLFNIWKKYGNTDKMELTLVKLRSIVEQQNV